MKNKLCTIAIYYGSFNNYFRLWLRSCQFNPTVDFLIITDIIYVDPVPENVVFVRMSFDEVRNRATKAAGFDVAIQTPYKLCDYRPLYGKMFSDILDPYDYWGHNDLDMLYGDIKFFFEKYKGWEYDKFLPLGHLAFYKNSCEVNNYYQMQGSKCGNYKEVFTTGGRGFAFDENIGINSILVENGKKLFYKRIFIDVSNIYHRYKISEMAGVDGVYEQNFKKQVFYWENGHVYRDYVEDGRINRQEFIYIHLFRRPNFDLDFDADTTNAFYITPSGFIPKDGNSTIEMIDKLNPYKSSLFEGVEFIRWSFGKMIDKSKKLLCG